MLSRATQWPGRSARKCLGLRSRARRTGLGLPTPLWVRGRERILSGASAMSRPMVGGSKRQEQQLQLLLAQVRMRAAQSPDLAHHRARPLPSAPPLRGRATGHQRREVATLGAPFRSPAVQGASAYRVGFLRGGQPVALPEAEYFQATLGTFGDHAPA